MKRALMIVAAPLLLWACEDGPPEIFKPNKGDPIQQNGYAQQAPWFQDGAKDFDYAGGTGDSTNRARFCDERELTALVNDMVTKPVIPNVGLAGINFWGASGAVINSNTLIGRPEDGKFCDPQVYSDALVWGPNGEVIAFIDSETKLIDSLQVGRGYGGTLEAQFTAADTSKVPVKLAMRSRARVGGRELDVYASAANQAAEPNSWLNHARINELSLAFRETFLGLVPGSAVQDCFDTKLCQVFYSTADQSNPQVTNVYFVDSGVYLVFSPDGYLVALVLMPVRKAPFEAVVTLDLLAGDGKVAPKLTSTSVPTCTIEPTGQTWASFQAACVAAGDTRTLALPSYNVLTARDAVAVAFKGIELTYLRRPVTKATLLRDAERPGTADGLYGFSFYRDLNAPVAQFVPATLAARYKDKVEARLRALVAGSPGHPFLTYSVTIPPGLSASASPIGGLDYRVNGETKSAIDDVIKGVLAQYETLSEPEREAAKALLHPVYLIEPFVDAVLSAFTNGVSDDIAAVGGFKGFYVSNDRRWSVGYVHYKQDGVPLRLVVQYSRNYNALTAVTFERGGDTQLDELFAAEVEALGDQTTYYGAAYAQLDRPLSLGGTAIQVVGSDRKLGTVDILLDVAGSGSPVAMTVSGTVIADQGGFNKQLRGERFEFVPAHRVSLLGRQSQLVYYVTEARSAQGVDGCTDAEGCLVHTIAAVTQSTFKDPLELCDGLSIAFGDDVVARVDAWSSIKTAEERRACDLVYNYSPNGQVLESVASLAKRVSFGTSDGRAVSVTLWK